MIEKIDLHVLVLLLIVLVLTAFFPALPMHWRMVLVAACPQGIILTRVLHDYPRMQRPVAGYLMTHEVLVLLTLAACIAA